VITVIIRMLLDKGADPGKVNGHKDTPLHVALEELEDAAEKSKTVCLALLEAKAPVQVAKRIRFNPTFFRVASHFLFAL